MILDQLLFERIVRNLIMNAIVHSPNGGTVVVRLSFDLDRARMELVVDDEGPGVPTAQRESIFKKFRQGGERASGDGAGLGLAFCKMAAAAHHGSIRVGESESGGGRFRVLLPLLAPDGQIPLEE